MGKASKGTGDISEAVPRVSEVTEARNGTERLGSGGHGSETGKQGKTIMKSKQVNDLQPGSGRASTYNIPFLSDLLTSYALLSSMTIVYYHGSRGRIWNGRIILKHSRGDAQQLRPNIYTARMTFQMVKVDYNAVRFHGSLAMSFDAVDAVVDPDQGHTLMPNDFKRATIFVNHGHLIV
ncbi:hypothetical protein BT96DRAFT_974392 [Gymnopus androsaceus JB14]|uniref:Uncharacterized protein n=1 Tax=Gymnopus androsaceus JB14 TaxID=1447944 RepID=A0A6A4I0Q2_9AGAR|nr:hypothetical protein BT96DRAFT_974392 [Gymnopus androsaceus JB14]